MGLQSEMFCMTNNRTLDQHRERILGALDHPNSGVINFDGRDLARLPEADLTEVRADSIGFVSTL